MRVCKLILTATTVMVISSGVAHTQQANPQGLVNSVLNQSLQSINECYHGVHQPSPCTKNVYVISSLIYGRWQAEGKPWSLEFSPNGIFNLTNGTISMTIIGPTKTGTYHISDDNPDSDYSIITVDMGNGEHFRSRIAMFGGKLILVDESGSTTFNRASFSKN
jgi:hypothetical protein